jgi:CheY-like chemotaxis protein/predicted transcriptional regulator
MLTSIERIPTAVGANKTMEQSTPDIVDILNVLSDDKTLDLLRNIACVKCCSSDSLLRNTQLTHKQYYSRMPGMSKAGLVRKTKGRYCLTSLGKVFYYLQITAQNALSNYWKLKAIDSFDDEPDEERQRFLDSVIDDQSIKEIITKKYPYPTMDGLLIRRSLFTDYPQQEKSSLNVMIVEDEPDTLLTYRAFLSSAEGYNVDTFLDSNEALKRFVNLNHPYYDLVITDIRMPGLNGLQLYQKMKSIDDSIKVMFVSALDAVQELTSIFPDLHFNNIIRKPVAQKEFLKIVKAAIGQD